MAENIAITGGAGPEDAAAIAAVIGAIEAEEKAALAASRRRMPRSQWIEAGRPLDHVAPRDPREHSKRPGQIPEDEPPF
jgi:hypothetical protein